MLNFDKKDAHVYPFDESPGAGIIMDVDLEQLIRESERLRVCKAIFNSSSIENWHLRDALEAVLQNLALPLPATMFQNRAFQRRRPIMLNRIVLMGRLTRDPELRRTQSGTAVVSFSIACDRDYAAQGAERETDFIDIVAWRGTAEFVEKYFSKGRMIVVGGRLQIRNWQDKEGNKRRSAEILADSVYFGDSKRDGDSGKPKGEPTYDPTGGFSQLADDDSELPF